MHFAHYILVVSLLPRLEEPFAHPLELWFLQVCVKLTFEEPLPLGTISSF
jgi:hypothetical protein